MQKTLMLNRCVLLIFGIVIALFLLVVGNVVVFHHQEDAKRLTFAISTCDEAYQMESDSWVEIQRIKTDSTDLEVIRRCDAALAKIGQSKDIIMKLKGTLEHR